MKKSHIAVLAFMGVMFMGSAPAWAFRSVKITTVTANATTGGQPFADFTLAIRDVTDPFGDDRTAITWSGAVPGNWLRSDQLLLIVSTVTGAGSGVQIYTDNTSLIDANPRFIDPTPADKTNPDSLAAGMLEAVASTTSFPPLAMAWSVKASSTTIPPAINPNTDPAFQWLFYKDKYNDQAIPLMNVTPFVNGEPFITMINNRGIHGAQGPNDFFTHPDGAPAFVYIEADFTGADVNTPYATSVIRVEAYVE